VLQCHRREISALDQEYVHAGMHMCVWNIHAVHGVRSGSASYISASETWIIMCQLPRVRVPSASVLQCVPVVQLQYVAMCASYHLLVCLPPVCCSVCQSCRVLQCVPVVTCHCAVQPLRVAASWHLPIFTFVHLAPSSFHVPTATFYRVPRIHAAIYSV